MSSVTAYAVARSEMMMSSSGVPDWRSSAIETVCLPEISAIPDDTDVVVNDPSVMVVFCVCVTAGVVFPVSFGTLTDEMPCGRGRTFIWSAVTRPARAISTKSSISHRGGASSPPEPAVDDAARSWDCARR